MESPSASVVSRTFDVVVLGSIGIDTNIYLPGEDIDFSVEANFTQNVDYIGQAGGYACRAYRSLGKRTAMIGRVGDDIFGQEIRRTLEEEGIDASALFVDRSGTARSVNFMYHDGRRKNFYDGKGHMTFEPDLAVCRKVLAGARLVHVNLANWTRHLLPIAQELDLVIACDVQDMTRLDDPYRQDYLHAADIVFFSAVNQDSPDAWIRALVEANPDQIVIAGMGAEGCTVGIADDMVHFPVPPMNLPVIDSNGAGDLLAAGFLCSYILDGYSLEDSVLRGQIAARHVCSLKGTTEGLIREEELNRYHANLRAP